MTYRVRDDFGRLIQDVGSKSDEVVTKSHQLSKQLEGLMEELRNDRELVASSYSRHKARITQYTGIMMKVYENPAPRKIITLLNRCATKTHLLADMAVEDFMHTDAFRLLQQIDEYEFISGTAKNLQASLKQTTRKPLKDMSVADVFTLYDQLKVLMSMIEKSNKALFEFRARDVDVIHKDWSEYYARCVHKRADSCSGGLDRLELIRSSGEPANFIVQRKGQWNHQQWLTFRTSIIERFGEVSDEALGCLLEEEKRKFYKS